MVKLLKYSLWDPLDVANAIKNYEICAIVSEIIFLINMSINMCNFLEVNLFGKLFVSCFLSCADIIKG